MFCEMPVNFFLNPILALSGQRKLGMLTNRRTDPIYPIIEPLSSFLADES
jgi:hypothetical protein